ncbi:hypothetical protein KCU64_g89, partial [Aureobasidium melanogenum]
LKVQRGRREISRGSNTGHLDYTQPLWDERDSLLSTPHRLLTTYVDSRVKGLQYQNLCPGIPSPMYLVLEPIPAVQTMMSDRCDHRVHRKGLKNLPGFGKISGHNQVVPELHIQYRVWVLLVKDSNLGTSVSTILSSTRCTCSTTLWLERPRSLLTLSSALFKLWHADGSGSLLPMERENIMVR